MRCYLKVLFFSLALVSLAKVKAQAQSPDLASQWQTAKQSLEFSGAKYQFLNWPFDATFDTLTPQDANRLSDLYQSRQELFTTFTSIGSTYLRQSFDTMQKFGNTRKRDYITLQGEVLRAILVPVYFSPLKYSQAPCRVLFIDDLLASQNVVMANQEYSNLLKLFTDLRVAIENLPDADSRGQSKASLKVTINELEQDQYWNDKKNPKANQPNLDDAIKAFKERELENCKTRSQKFDQMLAGGQPILGLFDPKEPQQCFKDICVDDFVGVRLSGIKSQERADAGPVVGFEPDGRVVVRLGSGSKGSFAYKDIASARLQSGGLYAGIVAGFRNQNRQGDIAKVIGIFPNGDVTFQIHGEYFSFLKEDAADPSISFLRYRPGDRIDISAYSYGNLFAVLPNGDAILRGIDAQFYLFEKSKLPQK